MKSVNEKDLIHVIDKSTEEMHQQIDLRRHIMTSILERRVGKERLGWLPQSSNPAHEFKLREAIKEAIEVLEQTRKAFKSKRLETLRKKLTQVLINPK
jgi:hypothetical protein